MRPIYENWKYNVKSENGVENDENPNNDEINDLKILRLMVTPAYVFSCYLSILDGSEASIKQSSNKKMEECSCIKKSRMHTGRIDKIECHLCPANNDFVPITNCRQHLECNDPIYTCIDLTCLGLKLANQTPEFAMEYLGISDQAKALTVQLLGQCSTTDDVETLLEEDSGSRKYFNLSNTGKYISSGQDMKYPRLKLAIEFNHKEFVGHMYCQQMLKNEWYCNRTWAGTSILYKVSYRTSLKSSSGVLKALSIEYL